MRRTCRRPGHAPAPTSRRFPAVPFGRLALALSVAVALLSVVRSGWASTFYVDGASPACSDSLGGTLGIPYCTISAAMAAHNGAGVTISVAPAVYHERIFVPKPGGDGNPFVLQAAGSGVVIDGTGISGGIFISGRSWVVVDGFTVTAGSINVGGSVGVVLTHNVVQGSGGNGISASNSSALRIASNVIEGGYLDGLQFRSVATSTVEDNEIFGNDRNGIEILRDQLTSHDNVFRRNRLRNNAQTGLYFEPGSVNNLAIQNLCWGNGEHGIRHSGASGCRHIGDVVWGNGDDGISVRNGTTGASFSNCIVTENGVGIVAYDLYVDSTATTGFVSDDNVIWNTGSQKTISFGNATYWTIPQFSAATGLDTRSLQADPRFVAPETGDFHLQAGSPAIDCGNSSVTDWPAVDADGLPRADDVSMANTGLGPVTFADRGAFEYHGAPLDVGDRRGSNRVALSSMAPNPVRSVGRFSFEVRATTRVRLTVVDVQGRTIATLADRFYAPGRYETVWDGSTRGGIAGPGLYFLRLQAAGFDLGRRFVIAR